jgi:hypothetical protein
MSLKCCAHNKEISKMLNKKAVRATKQKGARRNIRPNRPKPEEKKGMPQHEHYLPARRREDRNPKCHEEQRKDVA